MNTTLHSRNGGNMKDFSSRIKPTIVNEKVCVFEFQVIRKIFFWKRVVYEGYCIIGRNHKRFLSNFCMPKGVFEFLGKVEGLCASCAEQIFAEYDTKNKKVSK